MTWPIASGRGTVLTVTEDLVDIARGLAEELLAQRLPRRWRHVQGVARRASELASGLTTTDQSTLVAAAWLYDIGYAPEVALTGLHPLDGARFLAGEEFPPTLVQLVAYHSGAEVEADERHLLSDLLAFPEPPSDLLRRLTAADMTTSPDGDLVNPRFRIKEILARYEPEHPVHRAVLRSGPALIAICQGLEIHES